MPIFNKLSCGERICIWICIAVVIALIIAVIVVVIIKCCRKSSCNVECFKSNLFNKKPKTIEKFEGTNDTNRWNYVNSYINSVLGNSFAESSITQESTPSVAPQPEVQPTEQLPDEITTVNE